MVEIHGAFGTENNNNSEVARNLEAIVTSLSKISVKLDDAEPVRISQVLPGVPSETQVNSQAFKLSQGESSRKSPPDATFLVNVSFCTPISPGMMKNVLAQNL